jgi:hypothetical protein
VTFVWFAVWLIASLVGDKEPLTFITSRPSALLRNIGLVTARA